MKYFLFLVFLLAGVASPGAGQSVPDNNTVLALQGQLIQVLSDKDTTKFISLIAPSGVTFGVDGDKQFKEQIQEQFEQKRDAYCVLFDSKCLSRETPRKRMSLRPCSVHDLVSRANGWSMEHQAGQEGGTAGIRFLLKPNNDLCSNGKDPIEFDFTAVADEWKLAAVSYE